MACCLMKIVAVVKKQMQWNKLKQHEINIFSLTIFAVNP